MAELPDWDQRPEVTKVVPVSIEGDLASLRIEVYPPIPSDDWTTYFDDPQLPKNIGRKPRVLYEHSMGKTIIEGACRDDEFVAYVDMVKELVRQANTRYEEFDVPQLDAQLRRETQVKEEERRRLDELKRRAEGM
ncbi:MAG: hypothetical protein ACRDKT_09705 [Actinomycetota bacterium]